eukprot:4207983-Pyramimonas_sp.AAC.1
MERFALRSVTSDFEVGPTYHGAKPASFIDHVAVFAWQMPSVTTVMPLKSANRRLKLIPRPGLQDHVPILMKVVYTLQAPQARPRKIWDFHRLGQALQHGTGAAAFARDLEEAFSGHPEYFHELYDAKAPDEAWGRWMTQ